MKRSSIAASFRRSMALGVVLSGAWSCSPAGNDSRVSGAPNGTAAMGGTGTGGLGAVGAGTSNLNLAGLPPDADDGPCMGLECQVPACTPGTDTTITGKVYAPNGTLPLYNVLVYVPNGPVPAFTDGAACDRCGASVLNPVTSAVTDETGAFVLRGAPAGPNIPLVMQVGKWRRQIVVPNVTGCVDTATDPQVTRLPRNKAEGDLPRIAIAAGGADAMECLPRRLGLDDAEHTTSTGDGRIHLYTATDNGNNGVGDLSVKAFDASLNAGAPLPHGMTLWQDLPTLMKYDIVILSCEGTTFLDEKPMASRQAMYDYASAGGRIFASHWHHGWFSEGPAPVPTTGTWNSRNNPTENAGPMDTTINQTFPKGEALAKWLVNVGASTTLGTLNVTGPRDNIQAVNPMTSREWITLQSPMYPALPNVVEYMSFNTPIGVPEAEACGRAVFTGLHVSSTTEDRLMQPPGFPLACDATELSPQEKAVAFMLFDLSSCIQNEDEPPKPPR